MDQSGLMYSRARKVNHSLVLTTRLSPTLEEISNRQKAIQIHHRPSLSLSDSQFPLLDKKAEGVSGE
jgi:hypothetical protein